MAINSSYQRSIDTAPFEVMFGRQMNNKNTNISIEQLIQKESLQKFNEERDEIRHEARQQILKVQKENQKTYDKKRTAAMIYNIDDLVAIKKTQFAVGQKISPNYVGPYKIIEILRANRYKVIKAANFDGPKETRTSSDYMKPL